MPRRADAKAGLIDSLQQVRALLQAEAFGDALNLGIKLADQLQTIIAFDNCDARLIADPTARDQALADLRARNYPSEVPAP